MTTPTRIATGLVFSVLLISGCGKASSTTTPVPPVTAAPAPAPSSPATAAPAPVPVPVPAPAVPGQPAPTVGVEHDLAQIENDLSSADQDLRLSTTPNQPSAQGE